MVHFVLWSMHLSLPSCILLKHPLEGVACQGEQAEVETFLQVKRMGYGEGFR